MAALQESDGLADEPLFDRAFQDSFQTLLLWRRDVRRFQQTPLPKGALESLLEAANLAPSVGLSQPWRFVIVEDAERRAAVCRNFEQENREALADYSGERARLYAQLKLAGLEEAPVHLAVFCEETTEQGRGVGRRTMPETVRYSVVAAIQNLWLSARAKGIGVGWVSILDPAKASETLAVPGDWQLIAYLCIGYPMEEHLDPELERHRWEQRRGAQDFTYHR